LKLLEAYAFTGNVRQLQNIVERAATLSDTDALGPESLPAGVRGQSELPAASDVQIGEGFSLERHLDDIERRLLQESLRLSGGVKMKAAQLLGLTFRSLRYRLAKHGLGDRED